jgi:hypothetical protein
METLPWELIGQIGGFLAPKWRCRLYLCCKEWYERCYMSTYEYLRVHKHMHYVLLDIRKIRYFICKENTKYPMSEIIKPNREPVYADSFRGDYGNPGGKDLTLVIYNGVYEYHIVDDINGTHGGETMVDFSNFVTYNYNSCKLDAMKYYMKMNNISRYKVFNCLIILKNYIYDDDLLNFVKAFNKDILMMYKIYSRMM